MLILRRLLFLFGILPPISGYAIFHSDGIREIITDVSPYHVNNIRDNYPYLYDVVTQNSPHSNAYQDICVKDLLCVSGLANFDLLYTDREGEPFAPAQASLLGVGIRPLHGVNSNNIFGSINNIDLLLDIGVKNWVYGHFDFAYVNANRRVKTFAHKQADWGSVYRSSAALKVNQAYLLFARPDLYPVYLQVGRINSPFGHYTPFSMTPTLPQLLSQSRTGGIVVGIAMENGFYGSLYWTISQESSENLNGFEQGGMVFGNNGDRNYGAKLGYHNCLSNELEVHFNAAYVADMRDSDYLLEGAFLYNIAVRREFTAAQYILRNSWVKMQRAEGVSLHGDFDYAGFGLSFDCVAALQNLSQNPDLDSKIYAYDLTGHARFQVFGFDTQFRASYQAAENTRVHFPFIRVVDDLGPPPYFLAEVGNVFPKYRYQLDYEFVLTRSISIAAQWVLDHDWDEAHDGTGKKSTIAMLRLHAEF